MFAVFIYAKLSEIDYKNLFKRLFGKARSILVPFATTNL